MQPAAATRAAAHALPHQRLLPPADSPLAAGIPLARRLLDAVLVRLGALVGRRMVPAHRAWRGVGRRNGCQTHPRCCQLPSLRAPSVRQLRPLLTWTWPWRRLCLLDLRRVEQQRRAAQAGRSALAAVVEGGGLAAAAPLSMPDALLPGAGSRLPRRASRGAGRAATGPRAPCRWAPLGAASDSRQSASRAGRSDGPPWPPAAEPRPHALRRSCNSPVSSSGWERAVAGGRGAC